MTQADVEVVRAAFSRWGRQVSRDEEDALSEGERLARLAQGIGESFDSGFHPEVEYREDPHWPGSSSYRGLEQVKACSATMRRVDPRRAFEAAGIEDGV